MAPKTSMWKASQQRPSVADIINDLSDCESDDDIPVPDLDHSGCEQLGFSIDDLLETRENDAYFSSPVRSVSAPIACEDLVKELIGFDLKLKIIDGCVFDRPDSENVTECPAFPTFPGETIVDTFAPFERFIIENFPSRVAVRETFMPKFNGARCDAINADLIKKLPISVETVKLAKSMASLCTLCENDIVISGDMRWDVFWGLFSGIMNKSVLGSELGVRLVRTFKNFVKRITLSVEEADVMVDKLVEVMSGFPVSALSEVIKFFPIESGHCAYIIENFGIRMIFMLLEEGNPALENLPLVLPKCQLMLNTRDTPLLTRMSAILALTERVIVCGIKERKIPPDYVTEIMNVLRFNTGNIDSTDMTCLREQIQMTRTQLEYFVSFIKQNI